MAVTDPDAPTHTDVGNNAAPGLAVPKLNNAPQKNNNDAAQNNTAADDDVPARKMDDPEPGLMAYLNQAFGELEAKNREEQMMMYMVQIMILALLGLLNGAKAAFNAFSASREIGQKATIKEGNAFGEDSAAEPEGLKVTPEDELPPAMEMEEFDEQLSTKERTLETEGPSPPSEDGLTFKSVTDSVAQMATNAFDAFKNAVGMGADSNKAPKPEIERPSNGPRP